MAKVGAPFEPGEEAVIFMYIPKTSFYLQRAKVMEYNPEDQGYIVKPLEKPISTMVDSKGYPVRQLVAVRSGAMRSETYVKNTTRRHGKSIIKDIFENIHKRKR